MKTKFETLLDECVEYMLQLQAGGAEITQEVLENIADENAPFEAHKILEMAVEENWIAMVLPEGDMTNLEPIVIMRKNIKEELITQLNEYL